jgi:hypothetical protein
MVWKCSVCGFMKGGTEEPPKHCECGAPAEKFSALSDEELKRIQVIDQTNDVHMEIINLAMKITDLAKKGMAINLDPSCVSLFKQLHAEAWAIKRRSKSELIAHVNGDKWY